MRYNSCPQEEHLVKAVRTGRWENALEDHVRECESCNGIARTAQWMQELAVSVETPVALPDPDLVWLKARLLRDQAQRERATLPWQLAWTSLQTLLAAAIALGVYRYWQGVTPELRNGIVSVLSLSESITAGPISLGVAASMVAWFIAWVTGSATSRLDRG